jgi:hypothetical protein
MYGNLVVCFHQIDLGEETTEKLSGVVVDMSDGIAVGDGTGVQYSVVASGMPTVVLLGYDM